MKLYIYDLFTLLMTPATRVVSNIGEVRSKVGNAPKHLNHQWLRFSYP
jgi:hypothetical protein